MIDSMKKALKVCQMFLLMCGVFGAETDEVTTVMEGDSVTLTPDLSKIPGINQMKWRFGDSGPVIAKFDMIEISYPSVNEMFGHRLKMNPTGSLTITNMRTKHAGLYKLEIEHNTDTLDLNFTVTVDESPAVIDAVKGETKSVSVTEGKSDTLQTDTKTHGDELIVWRFGDEGKLIAKHDIEAKSPPSYDTDERFRDRLKLNTQTGSLTITNFSSSDAGLYTVKISSFNQTLNKRFSVSVSAVPVSGLSGGAVAGIVVLLLLVFSAVAAAAVFYHRLKLSELQNLMGRQVKESVLKGRSVTLECYTEIKKDDKIQWMFETEQKLIAEMTGENRGNPKWFADEFRDQMKLDPQTGSLTIEHTRPEHSGLYKIVINSSDYSASTLFSLIVFDEQKSVSVMEGEDVILRANTGEQTGDHKIFWMFEDDNCLIDKNTEDECEEESKNSDFRFTDKVDLNRQTGDLTIKKIRTLHTGEYKLKIIRNGKTSFKLFKVSVYGCPVKESVLKGRSVTLKCDPEIQKDDKIQWMFETEQKLIAEMTRVNRWNPKWFADEFRDQMKLDRLSGSLIIQHTRPEHSGLYKIVINSSDYSTSTLFSLIVFDEQKSVSVMEGADVTLRVNTGEQTGDHKIFWMFEDENRLIDKNTEDECEESKNSDFRFTGKVDLNRQTGDLTIKKITTLHTGKYKLKIIRNGKTSFKLFNVTVSGCQVEKSVLKGRSVLLYTEIQKDDKIQWMFGAEEKLMAEMTGENCENPKWFTDEFKDQMKLDPQTGSLIIQHTRPEHSGLYKIVINSSDYSTSTLFSLTVFGEQKSVSVTDGEDVILRANTGELTGDHKIFWMFGDDSHLLAKNTEDECEKSMYIGIRFTGKVDLNPQTGDLTIKKMKTFLSGEYKLKIIRNGKTSFKLFNVTVYDSTEERENDSVSVSIPLLDGANERETTSSL